MEQKDVEQLFTTSNRRVNAVPTSFHRYMYDKTDWSDRLISIMGPRGCGKTTVMLQHIKEDIEDRGTALYVSLDNLWFASHDIKEVVEYHYTHGGKYLFLDEVHYYPMWQRLIKNLYDEYPDLKIVFTGSSMLQIDHAQADLSRRLAPYKMQGMSFREYLRFEKLYDMDALSFDDLISNHLQIAMEMTGKLKILPIFEKYCKTGYYPFYKEAGKIYGQRLMMVANQILESDYPAIEEVSISTIRKARKMLMLIAESVPQVINMSKLFRELETDRNQGLKMLYALQRSGLVRLLGDDAKSVNRMSRPDKIYLDNPNLMYALSTRVDIGTLRETFFFSQVSAVSEVNYPKQGDFLVNHKHLFEVGGHNKSFEQIKDQPDSYLALDGIEIGHGNRIPLWMFGLLY